MSSVGLPSHKVRKKKKPLLPAEGIILTQVEYIEQSFSVELRRKSKQRAAFRGVTSDQRKCNLCNTSYVCSRSSRVLEVLLMYVARFRLRANLRIGFR